MSRQTHPKACGPRLHLKVWSVDSERQTGNFQPSLTPDYQEWRVLLCSRHLALWSYQ